MIQSDDNLARHRVLADGNILFLQKLSNYSTVPVHFCVSHHPFGPMTSTTLTALLLDD